MKVLRATEFGFILSLIVVLVLGLGFAQTIPATPFAATSVIALPHSIGNTQPTRAFPRLNLWDGEVLTYLGMFSPDAVFHTTSKLTSTTGYSPGEGIPPADFRKHGQQHGDVPASMLLSNERVVENFEPPDRKSTRLNS